MKHHSPDRGRDPEQAKTEQLNTERFRALYEDKVLRFFGKAALEYILNSTGIEHDIVVKWFATNTVPDEQTRKKIMDALELCTQEELDRFKINLPRPIIAEAIKKDKPIKPTAGKKIRAVRQPLEPQTLEREYIGVTTEVGGTLNALKAKFGYGWFLASQAKAAGFEPNFLSQICTAKNSSSFFIRRMNNQAEELEYKIVKTR